MKYILEPANHQAVSEIKKLLKQHDPARILSGILGKQLKAEIYLIKHKDLGKSAEWISENGTAVDFNQGSAYVWLSVCHEMAHQFLRQPPSWDSDQNVSDLLEKLKGFKSKDKLYQKYGYDFHYVVEQTLAFLLQAAGENETSFCRKLDDKNWQDTFLPNGVIELAEVFWPLWIDWLKNKHYGMEEFTKYLVKALNTFSLKNDNHKDTPCI